jgi:hypothetical protein
MDRDLRRVVVVGLALAVALFTGRLVIASLYDQDLAIRQALSMRSKLRSGGEADSRPPRAVLDAARTLRDDLATRLESLLPRMAYVQPEAYSIGPGESPDLRYIEIVRREQELLVKGAAFVGRSVPSNLGMPELNPTGLEDVLRTLRSLHVVNVVVAAALRGGVDGVDEIKIPTSSRRQRSEAGFVRTHRVDFELHGAPEAVRDTLAGIAGGEPYLALDDVRIESLDDDGTRVRCRFGAVALLIDTEQVVLQEAAD